LPSKAVDRVPTKAVIFDFDGVLVDSEPMHEWAIRESVSPRGWAFTTEQFEQHIVGKGDENAYRRIAEWNNAALDHAEIAALLKTKWSLMAQGIRERRFAPQPGAAALVHFAAKRVPVGVCSGSVRATVEPMLRELGVFEALGALVTGDQVPMKPDPAGYLLAAKTLGAVPADCVAIEDTPTGVRAARNAGIRVIAVGHTVKRSMLSHADAFAERIADIDAVMLGL
jgi:beta-phosphoglucomutase